MKKLIRFVLVLIVLALIGFVVVYFTYNHMLTAPSNSNETVNIYVDKGSSYGTISKLLKENGLIRNETAYKVYLKMNPVDDNLEYGDYIIATNLSVEEVIEVLKKGSVTVATTKTVTFVEGKNMRYFIKVITDNFDITEDEVLKQLSDEKYLDELIKDYWFLTDSIKNKDIYYSLEGYLYPDTYEFYTNAKVTNIFKKLLDNMEDKLEPYKEAIENSKYNVHEIVTLASIIEVEAGGADRKSVSGVFYNRLKANMKLGSDVTGYYGAKMDDWTNGLGKHESDCNGYNTREKGCVKALPVGPICNPGVKSIDAALNPESHKYYYFVADCSGKTYLSKSYNEHINTVNRLVREGKWCDK